VDQSRLFGQGAESIEKAEAILLRAQAIHPKDVRIGLNPCLLRLRGRPARGGKATSRSHCAMGLKTVMPPQKNRSGSLGINSGTGEGD
jgi:hypothetical protein